MISVCAKSAWFHAIMNLHSTMAEFYGSNGTFSSLRLIDVFTSSTFYGDNCPSTNLFILACGAALSWPF
jgi:hypothetical protein